MTNRGDGTYVVNVKLEDGSYQYKFVVNGNIWVQDPHADPELRVDDGHQSFNSGIFIGEQGKDFGAAPTNDVTSPRSGMIPGSRVISTSSAAT